MPVSSLHFRASQHHYAPDKQSKITHAGFSNSPPETYAENRFIFPHSCFQAINSPEHLRYHNAPPVMQRNATSFAVQLLLLLSQIRPAEPFYSANIDQTLLPVADTLNRYSAQPSLSVTAGAGADAGIAETSWFNFFPGAAATPLPLPEQGIAWNAANSSYLFTDEQKIKEIIGALKDYFISTGQLSAALGDNFELEWRTASAGYPVLISQLDVPANNTSRGRRELDREVNPKTKEHIKANCAFEEEVLDTAGENKGKILLFQAQRAENPFRRIFDNNPDGRPSPAERGSADGLNIATDILTFGLKPFVGNMIANTKRRQYFLNKGDDICAERYRRLMLAETATSLDIDGIPYRQRGRSGPIKPFELLHTQPAPQRAAFYTRDPHTKIRKEVLIELKQGNGAINDNGRKIYLKPTDKENEFVTYHPHAVNPKALERKVIVNEETMTWQYADSFDGQKLDTELSEGKHHIRLYGDYYELHINSKKNYEIAVKKESGATEYLPVYMEPFSRTWHLNIHNGHRVFSAKQAKLIGRLKVKLDDKFIYFPMQSNNPGYYGSGKIYRAETAGDDSHYVQGEYIEMYGGIIPVRQKVTPGHGVRYEAFDNKKSYPVEWDGGRWIFEQQTSPQISKELKALFTADMAAKGIDASKVSASDRYGLKWDDNGESYLKIKNNYVNIRKLNNNRFSIMTPQKKVILRFKNNKFFIETNLERLDNILSVGLNGTKRKHALDVLTEIDGYTTESATTLLSRYDFPQHGFYSDYAFALHIEQTGTIPPWAKRFKKEWPNVQKSTVTETVSVTPDQFPDVKFDFHLGAPLGEGHAKNTYLDADDDTFVIKKFSADKSTLPLQNALSEVESFNSYYGKSAAQVFYDAQDNYYVKMFKTPGMTLTSLSEKTLLAEAEEKLIDLIETLYHVAPSHPELNADNIFWDAETETFYPGFANNRITSSLEKPEDKKQHWQDVLNILRQKIVPQTVKKEASSRSAERNIAAAEISEKGVPAPSHQAVTKLKARQEALKALIREHLSSPDAVIKKLDDISATIAPNSERQLQEKQIYRMQQLMAEIEGAVIRGEKETAIATFIGNNVAEVLNPGITFISQQKEGFDSSSFIKDAHLYGLKTTQSGTESVKLLYPEKGGVKIRQKPLDATAYEKAVAQLTDAEKDALRVWTALPFGAGASYSDGSLATGEHVNYEINQHLREGKTLTPRLQRVYDNMMSGLERDILPRQPGEYLRSAAYYDAVNNPWTSGEIAPGDYVSNLQQFMSVSSDTLFAKSFSSTLDENNNVIIHYKIRTKKGPTPLLALALSLQSYESEYLYKPHSLFKVVEYSVSEQLPPLRFKSQTQSDVKRIRIAAVLEEVEAEADGASLKVKDIFTGAPGELKRAAASSQA